MKFLLSLLIAAPLAFGLTDSMYKQSVKHIVQLQYRGRTFCSGTLIGNRGMILTAGHCIDDGRRITVLYQGKRYAAKILKLDAGKDAGLLRTSIRAVGAKVIRHEMQVLDKVFTIGHPMGVSNILSIGFVNDNTHRVCEEYYKTSCRFLRLSAYYGNSGGPIMNTKGEILSVVSMGVAPNYGLTPLDITIVPENRAIVEFLKGYYDVSY